MKLEYKNETIIIRGVIRSIEDIKHFEEVLEGHLKLNQQLTLEFVDAYTLPSSLIGYLNKKTHTHKLKIRIIAHHSELYELIKILALDTIFELKMI